MGEPESDRLAVCDAGPLIHLDELGCLDLLTSFAEVIVADVVWQEVATHRPSALRRRSIVLQHWTRLPNPAPALKSLGEALSLDAGEFDTLRIMQGRPEAIMLTDDAAARLAAANLGYEVHGTIGVVLRALRQQRRTKRQVLNLLRSIPQRSSLFVSAKLLESVMDEIRDA